LVPFPGQRVYRSASGTIDLPGHRILRSFIELLNGNGFGITFLEAQFAEGTLILVFFVDHHLIAFGREDVDRADLDTITALAHSLAFRSIYMDFDKDSHFFSTSSFFLNNVFSQGKSPP
jgi:hypothetical protein